MANYSPRQRGNESAAARGISVEELARRTGTTVSNLRALQARGLLDPPELAGRKGVYSERHQARVTLLRGLQDRGYSLAAIADLIEGWKRGAGLMEVLGLEDAVSEGRSPAKVVDLDAELPALAGDPALLERALGVELLVRDGGRFVAPDPEILEAFREYADAGYPARVLLEELNWLDGEAKRIATRFRRVFQQHVVAPFLADGAPARRLGELSDKVTRLRARGIRTTTLLITRALERGGALADAMGSDPGSGKPRGRDRSKTPGRERAKRRTR